MAHRHSLELDPFGGRGIQIGGIKMLEKRWFQSKTLWTNLFTVVAGGLTFLMSPDAKLDAQQVGVLGTILGVVNILLRLVTSQGISK